MQDFVNRRAEIFYGELDPLLHSQLRLAVMSMLVTEKQAAFVDLKEKTRASAGNLSIQLQRLKDAGYITVKKSMRDNYPLTTCRITGKGSAAFEKYVETLRRYIG